MAGGWSVSGRVARFTPEALFDLDSAYVIDVDAPLRGSLRRALRSVQ